MREIKFELIKKNIWLHVLFKLTKYLHKIQYLIVEDLQSTIYLI